MLGNLCKGFILDQHIMHILSEIIFSQVFENQLPTTIAKCINEGVPRTAGDTNLDIGRSSQRLKESDDVFFIAFVFIQAIYKEAEL